MARGFSAAGLFGIFYGLVRGTHGVSCARTVSGCGSEKSACEGPAGRPGRDTGCFAGWHQANYLEIYRRADRPQRQLESKNLFLSTFPRYAHEALGLVAIAVLCGLLVLQRGSGGAVIPLLGALALGAQRLLPALQQIYSCWANLNSWSASPAAVIKLLEQPLPQLQAVAEPRS